MNISKHDENGPLVSIGDVRFSEPTSLATERHDFDLPMFLVVREESGAVISYNDVELMGIGPCTAIDGFGSSAEGALLRLKDTWVQLDGLNADFEVWTTLSFKPCFAVDEEPLYTGAQRIGYVPHSWKTDSKISNDTNVEYLVWQNGQPTEAAHSLFDEIARLSSLDAAPARKGELHTILNREDPVTRDTFLTLDMGLGTQDA